MPLMGQREYARHRGCTLHAVQTALKAGRITRVGRKIDSEKADAQWEANTDAAMARHRKSGGAARGDKEGAYLEERTLRERLRRQREQLEFDRASGLLVLKTDVLQAYEAVVTRTRAALLGVPSKVKQQLPHLSTKDVVAIGKIIRAALSELANVDGAE